MKETVIGKRGKNGKQLELIFCVKGRILRYIVPQFDVLSEVILEGAYSPDEWTRIGSDKKNYDTQLANACVEFGKKALEDSSVRKQLSKDEIETLLSGKCPDRLTPHHAYPIDDDLVMQLVDRKDHKENLHYGASDMANPRQREKHIRDNKNWEISSIEKVQGLSIHAIHKHKHITSGVLGVSSAGLTGLFMKKILKVKNNKIVTAVSVVVGILCCIASECCLNDSNKKYL